MLHLYELSDSLIVTVLRFFAYMTSGSSWKEPALRMGKGSFKQPTSNLLGRFDLWLLIS